MALLHRQDRPGRPSPLACSQCRKVHLKCDAVVPACSRCQISGLSCSYTPSRRGGGRKRPVEADILVPPTPVSAAAKAFDPSLDEQLQTHGRPTTDILAARRFHFQRSAVSQPHSNLHPSSPNCTTGDGFQPDSVTSPSQAGSTTSESSRSSLRSENEHLVNLYYTNFHVHHPALVPRFRFALQNYPEYLQIIVKLIGSHYAPSISSDPLKSSAAEQISQCRERTPETVLALLLYALVLHARYEPAEAVVAINRAAQLAIELGMNHAEFAGAYGRGDAVYEDSLRRVWWELFVADGYLAALHRHTNFKTGAVPISTYFPCEESAYEEGAIPTTLLSLEQFNGRLFSDVELNFSSFCYRIDTIQILARVMAVSNTSDPHMDTVQAIDDAIAGWKFNLPPDKVSIINHSGDADPMMFQANMFIQISTIFLHFPRSELPITMPATADIACAMQHIEQVPPTSPQQHAIKAISASKEIANLATLPVEKYSPFFICGLVFACIVQLSSCSAYPRSTAQSNRDRVALIIGVLKSLSRNWEIAQYVSQQLKKAASEVFGPRAAAAATVASSSSHHDSGVDMGSFPIDMSWQEFVEGMQGPLLGPEDMVGLERN